MVNFEQFKELELKIGKILEAERVEGSEKLLKLKVDLGSSAGSGQADVRQILAGVGKNYSPEEMLGREIVVVANLEPRMLMGMESRGMLLAASDGGPVLLKPDKEVAPGSPIS
jgi:methionine--tRNA ligase beta chain